jgi:hypothetical protein
LCRIGKFNAIRKKCDPHHFTVMNNPPRPDELLENDLGPNDDSLMLGGAGRVEDPNETTDWQHLLESGEVMSRSRELEPDWSRMVECLDKLCRRAPRAMA